MDDLKYWYHSKTIWGALISAAAHLGCIRRASTFQPIVNIAGAIGGLLAVHGRLTATLAIRQAFR
ncbi:hypothetical protein N2599_03795 [Rhizobium sullae]|uniref:Uncharacterized protein n=1 Tax=Rhizobium sullae TaxID=50338 RepID=A0A2N0D2J3_RHISU|nr:hypothetical protein [Rhizobium sullae]PKA40345.1 hypothetical protein CWR43_27550 [Rhizobium sullae]UWU15150.1 hypothetical protein N2599_03795 [Rhizobium sullae]